MSNIATSPKSCQAPFPDPIQGLLRFRTVNCFSGASGAGKTVFISEFCYRMEEGRTIFGHATNRPTGYYVLAADRDWDTYQETFANVGLSDIPHYTLAEDDEEHPERWSVNDAFAMFDRGVNKLNPPPGALLIVDPVAPLYIKGDENRGRPVATSIHYYRRVARKRQLTLICSASVGKPRVEETYKRRRDKISGSGAFNAYSDTSFNIDVESDDETVPRTVSWQSRRDGGWEGQFIFDKATMLFVPYRGLQNIGTDPETDRPMQVAELLPEDGTPISRQDWYALAGPKFKISLATFKRDIAELLTREQIHQDSWGHYLRRKYPSA
jgi:hypothetical protein